ncbi:hypothetical protein ACE6H2_000746 [Prunus campanulata]
MREIWRDFPIQNPEFKSYHNWWNCATSAGEIAFAAQQIHPYQFSSKSRRRRPSIQVSLIIAISAFQSKTRCCSNKDKVTKLKQRKRKEKQCNEHEGDDKCYLCWNIQMDCSLAEILREECQMGHKGDGGWKSVAYNAAAAILSTQYNIEVSADNIKNHVKT